MPRCSVPHLQSTLIGSINSSPALVSEYVTCGGEARFTCRPTIPSDSSSRSCAVRTFSLMPGSSLRNSANRLGPNPRCHIASTFHLPASTLIVPCTGHPKLLFMVIFPATRLTNLCVLPVAPPTVIPSGGIDEKCTDEKFEPPIFSKP